MLVIRLTRKGRKNQPFFRLVVVDKKRAAKGGRAVDVLGYFDPLTKRKTLNKERILHWLKNGVQPSATVHNLLVREGIIKSAKIPVHKLKKKKESEGFSEVPKAESDSAKAESAVPKAEPEAAKKEIKPDEVKQEEKPAKENKNENAKEQKKEEPSPTVIATQH